MVADAIRKEDYEEPRCPFTKPTDRRTVPIRRIIEKLDEYLGRNDLESAAGHLVYWIAEAREYEDREGELTLSNEQVGLYRKCGRQTECFASSERALQLVTELHLDESVAAATTYINVATALKAFSKAKEAIPLYEKALAIYEGELDRNDARLAGLYNNMALALADLGELCNAKKLYESALLIMKKNENGEADMAITYCNLADLTAAECGLIDGERKIGEYLATAEKLLDTESLPHDGYYAFVCDKCAPTFGFYGYFLTERKLKERARRIYEGA